MIFTFVKERAKHDKMQRGFLHHVTKPLTSNVTRAFYRRGGIEIRDPI